MFERESSTYRRGLTLGLTVAEIFILILFILLLVLLALHALNFKIKRALEQTEIELVKKTNELEEIQSSLPKEIRHLTRENKNLKESITNVRKENAISKELLNQAKNTLEQERKLFPKDMQRITKDLADAKEENVKLTEQLENILQTNNQLRADLYASKGIDPPSKGIDPPCWYQVERRQGKRHEREHYLMDVAVHDEYLHLKLRDAPPGRAVDELGKSAPTSYAEEYATLPLSPLRTSGDLLLREFVEITEPIKSKGKNEEIRDYSCVFYVAVWDLTSATAKERWKKAEDAIKQSFYTYRMREDPWPHTDVAD